MSQPNKSSLEELYANLAIEDEEEVGVVIGVEEIQKKKDTFVLVGRFMTDKNINFQAMRNLLASIWRPKEGMEVHDIGGYRFSFIFYHIMDLRKVIEGGPWSFEQNMLVYKQVQESEDPSIVQLNEIDVWVQVHDIPNGFISENILKSVGNFVGKYVKSDPANVEGTWKAYVRIRVTLDIQKPLKRRMKIKREGGTWSWINFKYERMGNFCFVCGIIGHTERECSIVYENPDKEIERAYGVWLRAQNRSTKFEVGARWLRNPNGGGGWTEHGGAARNQATGSGNTNMARFEEIAGIMREKGGDTGTVVVIARNQETRKETNTASDLSGNLENLNVIVDPKRRRMEINQNTVDHGPTSMNTDGPKEGQNDNSSEINVSKNLYGVGSGYQAHREL